MRRGEGRESEKGEREGRVRMGRGEKRRGSEKGKRGGREVFSDMCIQGHSLFP